MPQEYIDSPNMSGSGSSQTPEMDGMFVGWTPGAEKEVRKTAPRLHHKKSRTGCQQCRARRVKVRGSLSFLSSTSFVSCFGDFSR